MIERRAFLCWLLSGAAALPLRGVHLHAQAAAMPGQALDTLRAVAEVVLPGELRRAGHDKVVNDFVQWLASYRSGAERGWGYGTPRKNGTAAIDTTRYVAQLDGLEQRARVQGGALSSLRPDVRRDVVIAAIEDAGVKDLPSSPNGRHVVTDVMSYFFNSSAALDLAYHARIRRATCRALKGSEARPLSGD